MGQEKRSFRAKIKGPESFLFTASAAAIFLTVTAAIFNFTEIRELCVCIANYLAYAWIAFAAVILGTVISYLLSFCCKKRSRLQFVLLAFQSAAFIAAMVFLLIFAALLLRVI